MSDAPRDAALAVVVCRWNSSSGSYVSGGKFASGAGVIWMVKEVATAIRTLPVRNMSPIFGVSSGTYNVDRLHRTSRDPAQSRLQGWVTSGWLVAGRRCDAEFRNVLGN